MIGGYVGKPIGGIVNTGLTSLQAAAGAYAITGPSAALKASIAVSAGVYPITGQSGAFVDKLPATVGAYTITGQGAVLAPSVKAVTGLYLIVGQSAAFATTEAVASGVYSITGNAAALNESEAAAKGSYAIAGASIVFRLAMSAAQGAYTIAGNDVAFTQVINGAGGDKRRRPPTRPVEVRLHDRKITVTDPDGTKRRVSYAKRFRPPPPLEEVPEWFLPPARRPAEPVPQRLLPQSLWLAAPPARLEHELADEEDMLALLPTRDPTVDAALALALVAAAEMA